jgi:ribosomal protein L29
MVRMKVIKIKEELRQLDAEQLRERREKFEQELFGLRFSAKAGHLKDYSLYGKLKTLIAIVQTFIRQKELLIKK